MSNCIRQTVCVLLSIRGKAKVCIIKVMEFLREHDVDELGGRVEGRDVERVLKYVNFSTPYIRKSTIEGN